MKRNKFIRLVGLVLLVSVILALSSGLTSCDKREKFDRLSLGMSEDEVERIFGKFDETEDTYTDGYDELSDWGKVSFELEVGLHGFRDCKFSYIYTDAYHKIKELDEKLGETLDNDVYNEYNEAVKQPYTMTRFTFDKSGALIEAFISTEVNYSDKLHGDYRDETKTCTWIDWLDGEPSVGDETVKVRLTFEDGSRYMGEAKITKFENGTVYFKCPWGETSAVVEAAE